MINAEESIYSMNRLGKFICNGVELKEGDLLISLFGKGGPKAVLHAKGSQDSRREFNRRVIKESLYIKKYPKTQYDTEKKRNSHR